MSLPTTKRPSKRVGDLQPNNLVFLDVDEELGEPRGIFTEVEATDHRGAAGVGAREHVKQLACGTISGGGERRFETNYVEGSVSSFITKES